MAVHQPSGDVAREGQSLAAPNAKAFAGSALLALLVCCFDEISERLCAQLQHKVPLPRILVQHEVVKADNVRVLVVLL